MVCNRIVLACGYYDVLQRGHVEYLQLAKQFAGDGGKLVVIVNNTEQAILKKGYEFMPAAERAEIIRALQCVDEVVLSIDTDRTVCETIRTIAERKIAEGTPVTHLLKGGDSKIGLNVPELPVCQSLGIEVLDGFGDKIQSSSWLIGAAVEKVSALKAAGLWKTP